jgi:hypothetical protein
MGAAAASGLAILATDAHASAGVAHSTFSFLSPSALDGDVDGTLKELRTSYPVGTATIPQIVHDLSRDGAYCAVAESTSAVNLMCVLNDMRIKDELRTPEQWRIRIGADPRGVVSAIDLDLVVGDQ